MPKVFVKPNDKKRQYGRVQHLSAIEPPAWLALMAGQSPDGIVVDMEAEGLDEEGLLIRLKDAAADEIVLLATGSHPSAHVQQTEAVERLKAMIAPTLGVEVKVYNYLPFDPTVAGVIPWDKLDLSRYRAHNWHAWGRPDKSYGATFSSISCPFKCDFCCVKDFYRSDYRRRAPQLVVADVKDLLRRKVTNIKMMDELFAIDNPVCREAATLLSAGGLGQEINIWAYARIDTVNEALLKLLRRAGVRWLAYGIESGNEAIRAEAMKGKFTNARIKEIVQMTHDADINIVGNYMFGFWHDTRETMQETLDLALELNTAYANFYCMSVYPGSKLYDEMKARGVDLPVKGDEFAQMSPNFKPTPTRMLDGREVLAFRDAAFTQYFTDSRYLAAMQTRFGGSVVSEIKDMTSINIRRAA
jgi:radical SAM superfamily enzyme YgiQ (UPF0313 family)